MKYRFTSREQVLQSPLFDFSAPADPLLFSDRCTHSTRLEDMVYHDLRGADKAAYNLLQDTFQMLYTHKLDLVEPEKQTTYAREFSRYMLLRLTMDGGYPELKATCTGNDNAAYEAAVTFTTAIADQMKQLAQSIGKKLVALQHLEKMHRMAFAKLRRLADLQLADDSELIAEACETASTAEQIRAVTQIIRDKLHQMRGDTEQVVADAIHKAQEAAKLVCDAQICWGNTAGDGKTMVYDAALMQRVRNNNMLKNITRQLGRMKELLSDLRKNAYAYGRGEKYSLTLGRNLNDLISGELGLLAAPETTPLFIRRYNAKGLRQYARRDMVRKGRGDIIVCLDESQSMEGEPTEWSKALALAMQDICAHEGRKFALVHFSSSDELKTDLFLPGQYSTDDLLSAAEHFFNGGTNFDAPMQEAFRIVDSNGFEDADIVFITDGRCRISDDLAETIQLKQREKHCSVVGLLLDMEEPGMSFSLEKFCERVYRLSELTNDAIEQDLFAKQVS